MLRQSLKDQGYIKDLRKNFWSRPDFAGIEYSDGDEAENRLLEIIKNASDLSILSTEFRQNCVDWVTSYHLSPVRANLVRPFTQDFKGSVLEIGAGCGAITRFLGECGGRILALEGSMRRAEIAALRTRDLENVTVLAESFADFKAEEKFDVVTLIGVLEYANLFIEGPKPALAMLQKARSFLKPAGKLIIAIENQLGLKYFAGAPEDHVGQPMYGIEGHYKSNQVQTYGRHALKTMLQEAEFSCVEFLFPFPDYKFPSSILTQQGLQDPDFDASSFAWQSASGDSQLPPDPHFSLECAWPAIFENQLAADLSNSFLIVASPENEDLIKRNTLAYYYNANRLNRYCKEVCFRRTTEKQIVVHSHSLYPELPSVDDSSSTGVQFTLLAEQPYISGHLLSQEFSRIVAQDGWTFQEVAEFFKRYLDILKIIAGQKGVALNVDVLQSEVPGCLVDALPRNILIKSDGEPVLFDEEWELSDSAQLGYILLRSFWDVISLVTKWGACSETGKIDFLLFINRVVADLGLFVPESTWEGFKAIEVSFQNAVLGYDAKSLEFFRNYRVTSPSREVLLRVKNKQLSQQIASLKVELGKIITSRSWRLTRPFRVLRRTTKRLGISVFRRNNFFLKDARFFWGALPLPQNQKDYIKKISLSVFSVFSRNGNFEKEHFEMEIEDSQYVPLLKAESLQNLPLKLIAFYLPQFHPIPENDAWWGKGFTEWMNVKPAQPQFEGHHQPHVPGELGYYNLLDPQVQKRQVELAKLYGIEGFCFYFYWFGGKRLLETPVNNYLANSELDLPFCLCWANENWTRRWDGLENEVLISQNHSPKDDIAFIKEVSTFFRDARYIRVNGRPILVVYRISLLPDAKNTVTRWREYCRTEGIGEIYLVATRSFGVTDPRPYGFDAILEFPPHGTQLSSINSQIRSLTPNYQGNIYSYNKLVAWFTKQESSPFSVIKTVCPGWDNTARRSNRGHIFYGNTPMKYKKWLDIVCRWTLQKMEETPEYPPMVFVNAWNEWAEGAHLEPDERHGYAYLQVTRDVLKNLLNQRRSILLVTHDCHPYGAQLVVLQIAKTLQLNGFRVFILTLGGGRLLKDFRAFDGFLNAGSVPEKAVRNFLAGLWAQGVRDVMTNTVVSGSMLPLLKKLGFNVLSLIHELPSVIRGRKQEKNAQNIARLADKIVFPASLVSQRFSEIAPFAREKEFLLPQGLLRQNPYKYKRAEAYKRVCEKHGLSEGTKIVLSVAYVTSRKGPDLFVEIAAHTIKNNSDTVFIWVGDDDAHTGAKIAHEIQERGLGNKIFFIGFISAPLDYYAAASVYALSSREDPFPNVVLESTEVGVPIVAFEGVTGAANFILENGGSLAKNLDTQDFSDKICKLISRESVSQKFPIPSMQQYTLDLVYHLTNSLRISVVVPNYNYGRYLIERLDSICKQNFPIYEFIILDDASTDDSIKIIEEYIEKSDTIIRLITNEKNSGTVFKQWAEGVTHAHGDLIWIAEADDLAENNFLQTVSSAFEDPEVVLAFSQSKQIGEDGTVLAPDYLEYTNNVSRCWLEDYIHEGREEIRDFLTIQNTIPNVSGVVFRRDALVKALALIGDDLFDYKVAGDWLVYIHVLLQGKIAYFKESLNQHRRHFQNVTQRMNPLVLFHEIAKVQQVAQALLAPPEYIIKKADQYREYLRSHFNIVEK